MDSRIRDMILERVSPVFSLRRRSPHPLRRARCRRRQTHRGAERSAVEKPSVRCASAKDISMKANGPRRALVYCACARQTGT